MVKANSTPNSDGRRSLLGLGLDNNDGHVRITRGKNFHLLGGSQQTHETMQEQAIKLNEKLASRGRQLDDVSRQEFLDVAHEVGMRVIEDTPDDNEPNE